MADSREPTNELITYLELRLEADGLDYREAVMIEDLIASLSKVQGEAGGKNSLADRDNQVRTPRTLSDDHN